VIFPSWSQVNSLHSKDHKMKSTKEPFIQEWSSFVQWGSIPFYGWRLFYMPNLPPTQSLYTLKYAIHKGLLCRRVQVSFLWVTLSHHLPWTLARIYLGTLPQGSLVKPRLCKASSSCQGFLILSWRGFWLGDTPWSSSWHMKHNYRTNRQAPLSV
jgi:hypothetical protein